MKEIHCSVGESGRSTNTLWCLMGLRTVKVYADDHLGNGVNSVNIMAVGVSVNFLMTVT